MAKLYNSWGECLNNLKRKEALDKIQESIKIKKQLDDRRGLAMSYGTLGRYYYYKYADRITGHDKQKALKAFENDLEICEELFDDANACKMHSFIGATHLKAGEPREAVPHLEKSIRLAEVLESRVDESHARLSLGKALMKVDRRDSAAAQVKKIRSLIQELEQEEQPQSALDFFRCELDLLQASLNVPGESRPNKETPSKTVARKKTPRKVAGKKAPAKKTPKKRARKAPKKAAKKAQKKAAKTAPKKAAKKKRT